jgi:hypothetical protein
MFEPVELYCWIYLLDQKCVPWWTCNMFSGLLYLTSAESYTASSNFRHAKFGASVKSVKKYLPETFVRVFVCVHYHFFSPVQSLLSSGICNLLRWQFDSWFLVLILP